MTSARGRRPRISTGLLHTWAGKPKRELDLGAAILQMVCDSMTGGYPWQHCTSGGFNLHQHRPGGIRFSSDGTDHGRYTLLAPVHSWVTN